MDIRNEEDQDRQKDKDFYHIIDEKVNAAAHSVLDAQTKRPFDKELYQGGKPFHFEQLAVKPFKNKQTINLLCFRSVQRLDIMSTR